MMCCLGGRVPGSLEQTPVKAEGRWGVSEWWVGLRSHVSESIFC